MTDKHREIHFETELVDHLTGHGWLEGDPQRYDRERALYPDDLIGWLRESQPEAWRKAEASYGEAVEEQLLARVVKLLDKRGTLDLLRNGFKDRGTRFDLCQFRPGFTLNYDLIERYGQVRCRVVRQVRYSLHNQNSLDLVLFINGLPVATLELKTDFTQSVHDAIRQYKVDRLPKEPQTRREEPLLAFKKRALVHFAVSTDEVHMTTRLAGNATRFLPFNQGHDGAAGNPPNSDGYRTSYLWETVLQRDNFLDIVGRFVHLESKEEEDARGRKVTRETLIFPRFHQWQAVTRLLERVQVEGAGQKYLIQHSAGSGKSNSIAWLAHQLSSLHNTRNEKIFDSIIVVTDRTVLDDQLQETIYQFDHKQGVVERISREAGGVKSQQLTAALVERKPIIIVTIQTFPFVLETIRAQVSLRERAFAVIADEAHSSQSGATAGKLKQVLTGQQIDPDDEVDAEDVLVATVEARQQPGNISFFAFTATPKHKTIELFGRLPDPSRPPSEFNKPKPFHVYSMQQAIEEGFILDVLQNYTPYGLAYRLAEAGQAIQRETSEREIDKSQGLKQLARWVRLHPHNISQKVQIVIEHFRANIAHLLSGRAKAMVVTGSRKEAVRYKLAMDKYIREQGYADVGTLVAFSGEVKDGESGPHPFTEANMNPDVRGRDLRQVFDTDAYQVLIVANKFQTGFDQPLLCAMYVDKKLSGVTAVQTLSRLNRTAPGKENVYVLDFVNEPDEIFAAFAPYFRTAALSNVSDPNLVHDLQAKLDDERLYTDAEVDAFARAYFDPRGKQGDLQPHIAPAVDRYRERRRAAEAANDSAALDALDIVHKDLGSFVRAYEFLSQIIDYGDSELEKRYVFYKHLLPWLRQERRHDPIDLSSVELTHYRLTDLGKRHIHLAKESGTDYTLAPMTATGTASPHEPEFTFLSQLIAQMNDLFAGELSDADLVHYATHIRDKMLEDETLARQAATNTKEQFALGDFPSRFVDAVIGGLDSYQEMAEQVLTQERTRKGFESLVLDMVYRGFEEMQRERSDEATGR